MGFAVEVLLVGVCVLGQLDFPSAAFEAPPCITSKENGSVVEMDLPEDWLKFAQAALVVHNKYRKKHGVPPLVLNPKMCKSARWTAYQNTASQDYVHTGAMPGFKMSCGENLHRGYGFETVSYFIRSFYSEIKDYDFAKHKPKTEGALYLHFTQVVWKDSKEMCMSYAKFNGTFLIAAHYYPPGNVISKEAENVFNSANHDLFNAGIIFILILSIHFF